MSWADRGESDLGNRAAAQQRREWADASRNPEGAAHSRGELRSGGRDWQGGAWSRSGGETFPEGKENGSPSPDPRLSYCALAKVRAAREGQRRPGLEDPRAAGPGCSAAATGARGQEPGASEGLR